MKKKLIILWLILTGVNTSQAMIAEECAIVVNKQWYVAGDTVWFELFLPLMYKYDNSILKASLYDQRQNNVEQEFHLKINEKGLSAGYFALPHNVQTGTQLIIISVFAERSADAIDLIRHPILVFNDQMDLAETASISILKTNSKDVEKVEPVIDAGQGSYRRRQQITMDIITRDLNGRPITADLALSVVKIQPGVASQNLATVYFQEEGHKDSILVENRIMLLGAITNSDSGQPIDRSFFSLLFERTGQILSSSTDREGVFIIAHTPEYGDYQAQIFDPFSRNIVVDLKRPYLPDFPSSPLETLINPEALKKNAAKIFLREKDGSICLKDSNSLPPQS